LSQAGKTYLVVFLLIGLLIGTGIGWFVKPAPTGVVPQDEYDELQSELDATTSQLNDANAELTTVRSKLDTATAELASAQEGLENLQKALAGSLLLLYEPPVETDLTGEVPIGGLFCLTGDLATYGENELTAAQFAAEQVNAFLGTLGVKWTLKIVPEDTETKSDIVLEKLESLAAKGIKLVIGPLSSGEVASIKGYCDANKILAISQSSTAPDLAIPDDFIFRFCPTDKLGQGPAISRILYEDGKRYVIPFTRNDAWGVGLEEATASRFEELGGTFLEGIRYAPEAQEFSAEASDLASKVTAAIDAYGADEVCVLEISFAEVVPIFTAASEYDVLSTVKWFGSDGTCAESAILEDPTALDFSATVEFPSTIFAPTESAKLEMVRQHNVEVLGREPESYSYTVYDIVWVYAMCLLQVDAYDAEAIAEIVPEVAASYFGASGWIDLDESGDRKAGDYVIWQIVETTPGEYGWEIVGKYILTTDSVEWYRSIEW